VASSLWLLTSVYSVGYMRGGHYSHQTGYFASFAVCVSATVGIAFAANLVTFFVFYEILTIATYPLVIHSRTREALRPGARIWPTRSSPARRCSSRSSGPQWLAPGASFQPGGFLPPGRRACGCCSCCSSQASA
jgi:multicomponent Na+:H+ antiporter subunit D